MLVALQKLQTVVFVPGVVSFHPTGRFPSLELRSTRPETNDGMRSETGGLAGGNEGSERMGRIDILST